MPQTEALRAYRKTQHWLVALALVIAGIITVGSLGAIHNANNQERKRNEIRQEFCVELEQIRSYVRLTATRALKTVPTIAYYKEHPEELGRQIEAIRAQRDAFSPPLDCNSYNE